MQLLETTSIKQQISKNSVATTLPFIIFFCILIIDDVCKFQLRLLPSMPQIKLKKQYESKARSELSENELNSKKKQRILKRLVMHRKKHKTNVRLRMLHIIQEIVNKLSFKT